VEEDDQRNESDVEEAVRQRIWKEAVQADVVVVEEEERKTKWILLLSLVAFLVVCLAILALGLGLGLPRYDDNDNEKEATITLRPVTPEEEELQDDVLIGNATRPTLEDVLGRGFIRCGVYDDIPGFSLREADGNMTGFNFQIVRTIAQ
jgi:hypothetical protein